MIDLTNSNFLEGLKTVPPGHVRLIGVDNQVNFKKRDVRMAEIRALIGAKGLDTVNLRNGCVMLVDDTGSRDGKPVNEIATRIYLSMCKPGTTHEICGDVAIVRDSDFA